MEVLWTGVMLAEEERLEVIMSMERGVVAYSDEDDTKADTSGGMIPGCVLGEQGMEASPSPSSRSTRLAGLRMSLKKSRLSTYGRFLPVPSGSRSVKTS